MDVTQVLEATLSPNTAELQLAQQQLEQAAANNLSVFLLALSSVLGDVTKSATARMAAGLQLKNYLTSKNLEVKLLYQQRWCSMEAEVRQQIKTIILATLGTESTHRSAAQCVAYIAAAEIPTNQWPELIQTLLVNVTNSPATNAQSTEDLKEASLEAIGYICEDLEPRFLASQANEILTAIVRGMSKDEPTQSNKVKLAATKALLNSLEFTKANFEKESERHIIMQVVCEATQSNYEPVQVTALQNLVKIMGLYYHLMEAYMGPALFAIALEAMKSPTDEIALQGIEFWSTVCDEEVDLAIEAAEAVDQGRPPEQASRFYVKGAQQYLIPVLMLTLTKQEEYDDDDDWNPCKAAGVCLSLMASCCEDTIVPHIIPFVQQHLKNPDWKFRDAAVMALGSILEGPSPDSLQSVVFEIMEVLLMCMSDESVQVRDSTAWTIGRICEHVPVAVLNDKYLIGLLQALTEGLAGEPRVATNICWAFSSLAEAAFDLALENSEEEEPETYCLSSLFEVIITKLVATTNRVDAGTGNLRSSAYEALMDLIKYSAKDCYPMVQQTTQLMIHRIKEVLAMDSQVSGNESTQLSGADRQQLSDLESLLCATLQSLLRKVNPQDAQQISDTVMESLLLMFQSRSGQSGGVQEDAIMTVGVLVDVVGASFVKYMGVFQPILLHSLKNHVEHQACLAAVGLIGDLCRALGVDVANYCDNFMIILLENLSNNAVHRSVKPQILSTIGDIALALGTGFTKYLEIVLQILQQAACIESDKHDFEMIDYVNELREGCLEAYTGIVQGLKGDNEGQVNSDVEVIFSHVDSMLQFIERIAKDDDHTDSNVACSCGLLGDLCTAFGAKLFPLLSSKPAIMKLANEGRLSRMKRTKTVATWALKEMQKLSPQSWCFRVLRSRCSGRRPFSGYGGLAKKRPGVALTGLGLATAAGLAWTQYRTKATCSTDHVIAGKAKVGLPDYKLEEISSHKTKETGIWVMYGDGVYDITEFVDTHPGGGDKIILAAGGSLEPYWEVFAAHKTDEVKALLEELRIGNVHPSDRGKTNQEMKGDGPYANDPKRSPILKINTETPFNAETPIILLANSYITPNNLFFVRNHLPVPDIDPEGYVLEIKGQGMEPVRLTLEDLRSKFTQHTVTATIQCAGNRRSELADVKQVRGLNWTGGAIGTAQWTGVRLRDVLMYAGLKESDNYSLKHVHLEGLDTNAATGGCYGASIPIEKAMDSRGDCLLALEMNGEPLPRDHGYPVRAVVPGTVGARNVKWLSRIEASKDEYSGFWQQNDYKGFSPSVDWDNVDFTTAPAIQELPVTSMICFPKDGTILNRSDDSVTIGGVAWSGGGREVIRVDVSCDGGKTWGVAELTEGAGQTRGRAWAWILWEATLPLPKENGKDLELCCKAVDMSYNVQPDTAAPIWNLRGCLSNAWHRVKCELDD